jgi:hypothetical protein
MLSLRYASVPFNLKNPNGPYDIVPPPICTAEFTRSAAFTLLDKLANMSKKNYILVLDLLSELIPWCDLLYELDYATILYEFFISKWGFASWCFG